MIHAYDEQYLYDAMRNLGEAFDFAWTICHIELDTFLSMMISSGAATQFEHGSPKYVCGMSGTELVLIIPVVMFVELLVYRRHYHGLQLRCYRQAFQ